MNDTFRRDPPRSRGKAGYRMDLRLIEPSGWLPDRIAVAERSRKLALLDWPAARGHTRPGANPERKLGAAMARCFERIRDALVSVVFRIRLSCRYLSNIGYAQALHDLLATLDTLDSEARHSSGSVHYGAAIAGYLRPAPTMGCTA